MIYASESKLYKELKNSIETYVGQMVLKLWIKTYKILFWSITQEPLGLLNFNAVFEFLDNLLSDACIIFQKSVDSIKIEHKTC